MTYGPTAGVCPRPTVIRINNSSGGTDVTNTDTVEQDMVTRELRWDRSIDSANIGVSFDRGAVTLSGHVASYAEKDAAEKAVKRVRGVTAVANELEVHLSSFSKRDDTDIAVDLARALAMNVFVPKDSVKVTVQRHGWVTLEGTVPWDYQRLAAAKVARQARGVLGVTNAIKLETTETARDIEKDIHSALQRYADVDARAVHVTVRSGVATLTGRVSSWGEVTAARRAAAAAPGIYEVKEELRVEPVPAFAGV